MVSDGEGEAYGHYSNVLRLLREHHSWFNRCIPLIASENVPSPAVREAIASDFANRYAEGWPGERVYAGCVYIDQVELICIELARRVFRAEFADVRPVSGVVANLAVYAAFTEPNDIMLALAIPNGGHISHGKREHSGTAGLVRGLQVETFAFNREEMNIDVDSTIKKVEEMKRDGGKLPRLAMFGASLFLFPHPVRELADYMHANNMTICYDAAHVAGLIAGNEFQDPLREGADIMTMSTHKTLFGPQGGMILSFERHAEGIKKAVFPGNTSSHHLHNVAGKAIALAEMLAFGGEYARQVVRNARALAEALHNLGFDVLGEKHGFTRSHQVAVDISRYGDGGSIERALEKAGIICNRQLLPGDIKAGRNYRHPGGIRLGTAEVTRLGMREQDMVEVARFIRRVVVDGDEASRVAGDVAEFRKGFQRVHYAFDDGIGAYEYISLVGRRK
ncbi:MAG: serine hydroxymethyltransferase [Candidatus Nitrosocaldus sp.]|nr:serine hydroxymethyltransferase [Candidatus Nitrosocaldus sp.]MDW8275682.1 serine hydroxymethyltransferase [Candidatus Nitrosocaldus sp.]